MSEMVDEDYFDDDEECYEDFYDDEEDYPEAQTVGPDSMVSSETFGVL